MALHRLACLVVVLVVGALSGMSANADWLIDQHQSDGRIAGPGDTGTALQSTSEAVLTLRALNRAGEIGAADMFIEAEAWNSTEYLARRLMSAKAAGLPTAGLVTELLSHQNADGGFGEVPQSPSSPLNTAFALLALDSIATPQVVNPAATYLVASQDASGSWSVNGGQAAVFVTAHVIQALWPHRGVVLSAPSALARAKTFLLSQRQPDQRWASDAESALSLIALVPMQANSSELSGSFTALAARQLPNGSWQSDVYTTALALRAFWLNSQPRPNPDLAVIRGTMVDGDTLAALVGVRITLQGATASTTNSGDTGAFEFSSVAAGRYHLTFEMAGYPTLESDIDVVAGRTIDLGKLRLLRSVQSTTARIEGVMTDVEGGALEAVQVAVSTGATASTDASGRFVINEVTPGTVTITASKPGHYSVIAAATLSPGSIINFSAVLREVSLRGFSLSGRFTDAVTGSVLSGVQVDITGSATASATSSATGDVALTDLAPGTIQVALRRAGYVSRSAVVTAGGGQQVDISTSLTPVSSEPDPAAQISGIVTDAITGQLVSGATITLSGANSTSATTAADGRYSIGGLAAGDLNVLVTAPGYIGQSASGVVESYQRVEWSAALVPVGTTVTRLSGAVVDVVGGAPIAGASITVSGAASAAALADGSGNFVITGLAPGPITVTITAANYTTAQFTLTPTPNVLNDLGVISLRPVESTPTVRLVGHVLDSATGLALAGAEVRVYTFAGVETLLSDGQGRFEITSAAETTIDVELAKAGYVTAVLTVPVQADDTDLGQIRLRPEGLDALQPDLSVTSVDNTGVTVTADTFAASGSLRVEVINRGYVSAGQGAELIAYQDSNFDGQRAPDETEVARITLGSDIEAGTSATYSLAVSGALSFRDAPLSVMIDANNTVIERDESNNTGVTIGKCVAIPPPASALQPTLKWYWRGSPGRPTDYSVYGPTVVGQLTDDNGDGQITNDDVPDLVFPTSLGALTAVSGDDGRTLWQTAGGVVARFGSAALGDIDLDGRNEIVIENDNRTRLYAYENDGTLKWSVALGPTQSSGSRDGVALADLNADGNPEIVVGRRAYSAAGALLWEGTRDYGGYVSYGTLSVPVDLDRDGVMEVVAGRSAYRANGALHWHQASAVSDGFTAIGNFDDDDYPEVVLVASRRVYLLEHTGAIKWGPVLLSGTGDGGAPTIGDFDGDGKPEIGIAGSNRYTVLETDGSVRWLRAIQDVSSHKTGSSLFDFDGDGRTELVYADEVSLFIFDGATGATLVSMPNGSATVLEYPVVADVDGDGRAELVVTSGGSGVLGVRVFEGGQSEWMPTRSIWNQSTYHITNVDADGRIPRVERQGWLVYNSFRQNETIGLAASAVADLTAGALRLVDNGTGVAPSLEVRIGNAGAPLLASTASVSFYAGSPSQGGTLLGSVALGPLASGAFVDVRLPSIGSVPSGTTLVAWVDSLERVTECNEENNFATSVAAAVKGKIFIEPQVAEYPPGADVLWQVRVENAGVYANAYRAEVVITDAAGNEATRLPDITVPLIDGGTLLSFVTPWATGSTLAGTYRAIGTLYSLTGEQLGTAQSSVVLRHDTASGPAATLRVTTDRPIYNTSDAVAIETLARNLTTTTLISAAAIALEVTDPAGGAPFSDQIPAGDLAPGNQRVFTRGLTLNNSPEGDYVVTGRLLDAGGAVLATATTSFSVVNDISAALRGEVAVANAVLFAGDAQLCSSTISNVGSLGLSAVPLRHAIVNLSNGTSVLAADYLVDLAGGADYVDSRSVATSGLEAGDYACVLQARAGGSWATLGFANFTVKRPPIRITSSLQVGARGAVLVLLDGAAEYNCEAIRSLEMWAPFPVTLPSDAAIRVELLNAAGQRADIETVTLATYNGAVNASLGRGADLAITGVSPEVLSVALSAGTTLPSGYRLVATITADSTPAVVLDSGVIGEGCGLRVGQGTTLGSFEVVTALTPSGASPVRPPEASPTLAEQRAFLEQLLVNAGWTYRIATDADTFTAELRSGAYSQYALFASRVKLDEQVQRELREAVFRGEGLLDAGEHDQRHQKFDEALGTVWKGHHAQAAGVEMFNSAFQTAATVPLLTEPKVLRFQSAGAAVVGQFFGAGHVAGGADEAAVTTYTYGIGRSIEVGYDLLAEATRSGSAGAHAGILLRGLEYVQPSYTSRVAGQVVPVTLRLANEGIAVSGRVVMPLPSGAALIDAGGATFSSGVLSWPYSLALGETRTWTVLVRLPEAGSSARFEASVQTMQGNAYSEVETLALSVAYSTSPTLAQTLAIAQSTGQFSKTRHWLEKAQSWINRGRVDMALVSLVQASDEVRLVSHPQATSLRMAIDQLIGQVGRQLATQ